MDGIKVILRASLKQHNWNLVLTRAKIQKIINRADNKTNREIEKLKKRKIEIELELVSQDLKNEFDGDLFRCVTWKLKTHQFEMWMFKPDFCELIFEGPCLI